MIEAVHVTAIIAAGGLGSRFGGSEPKQLLPLAGHPILQHSVDAFLQSARITDLIVALPQSIASRPPAYLRDRAKPIAIVVGGERRQDSVARAFARVPEQAQLVVIHDAARPLVTGAVIQRTVDAAAEFGAAIAALPATDTVKRSDDRHVIVETLPRTQIFLAQTPQAFRTAVLRAALDVGHDTTEATDEAALAERAGHQVRLVEGDVRNLKITTPEDLAIAERLIGPSNAVTLRIGNGYDLHRLVPGRRLILGGVTIPFDKGLDGHSDADAVCHAVTDAILGAAGAGDIGRHFPDTDPAWKGADSLRLLAAAAGIVRESGYQVVNVDVVVIAERPKLVPHIPAMRESLGRVMNIPVDCISVKGKTNEGVGSIGAGESIAVHAVALLSRAS
jgi:2-C-methyl-D-erythritol 4-phosphate cytidylyltransferase/2-C-methyl-D-erythritol 2,4-cyclodiphosphate synthase